MLDAVTKGLSSIDFRKEGDEEKQTRASPIFSLETFLCDCMVITASLLSTGTLAETKCSLTYQMFECMLPNLNIPNVHLLDKNVSFFMFYNDYVSVFTSRGWCVVSCV